MKAVALQSARRWAVQECKWLPLIPANAADVGQAQDADATNRLLILGGGLFASPLAHQAY